MSGPTFSREPHTHARSYPLDHLTAKEPLDVADDLLRSITDMNPARASDDDWYDQHKRQLAMAVLPARRYRRALEPGCGDGALSALLADRCDEVVSWDADPARAAAAAARLADRSHVRVAQAMSPPDWPDGDADLVLLSEVGCFLPPDNLDEMLDRSAHSLEPGGVLVAVHRRSAMPYYPGGGDDVHARLFVVRDLMRTGGYTDEDLRIDVFERIPVISGAT